MLISWIYFRLASARRYPKETFSRVVHRDEWPATGARRSGLLATLAELPRIEVRCWTPLRLPKSATSRPSTTGTDLC